LIPAALMGVPNEVIAILAPIHLFAQFWYHTQHIGKMGWLEYIIITPSQHRVHHAINPEYIDKNLGQILSIWDRMFGTFQEELDDVPPQYGVLKPAATWNPILINFQHIWRLIKDAWRTKSYLDKLRIWFMPTGWRPADVKERYPIQIVEDVYKFERYSTPCSLLLKGYAIFQLFATLSFLLFMLYNFSSIGSEGLLVFGAFIFVGIYGYTSIMDRTNYAIWIELIRGIGGLSFVYLTKDWFGLNNFISWGSILVGLYFVITMVAAIYFTYFEKDESKVLINT
jgi:hypothetical protein